MPGMTLGSARPDEHGRGPVSGGYSIWLITRPTLMNDTP